MKRVFIIFILISSLFFVVSCTKKEDKKLQIYVKDNYITGNLIENDPKIKMNAIVLPIISSEEIEQVKLKSWG